jgi:hypothetical protein
LNWNLECQHSSFSFPSPSIFRTIKKKESPGNVKKHGGRGGTTKRSRETERIIRKQKDRMKIRKDNYRRRQERKGRKKTMLGK